MKCKDFECIDLAKLMLFSLPEAMSPLVFGPIGYGILGAGSAPGVSADMQQSFLNWLVGGMASGPLLVLANSQLIGEGSMTKHLRARLGLAIYLICVSGGIAVACATSTRKNYLPILHFILGVAMTACILALPIVRRNSEMARSFFSQFQAPQARNREINHPTSDIVLPAVADQILHQPEAETTQGIPLTPQGSQITTET